jgi:hypothetical protein
VAAEQEAERGDQDQQQRKQGEEAVPGQQGGEVAALVVAELLDHSKQEPEPAMPLLVAVDAAKHSFNRVHDHCFLLAEAAGEWTRSRPVAVH